MAKATSDQLDALHAALAADLAKRLKEGEKIITKNADGEAVEHTVPVSAATLGQIRQFLKDNHIEVDAVAGRGRFAGILEGLPFTPEAQEPDDDAAVH